MRLTTGSPTHFTPEPQNLTATFTNTDGETWTGPIIGWAIVITWNNTDRGDDAEPDDQETRIEPVILAENKYPRTVNDYVANTDGVRLERINLP